MTDRESHRAAVEAGYASLAEYIEKWGEDKMDIIERLLVYNSYDTREEAADYIERLREALQNILKVPNSEAAQGIMKVFAADALQQKESE